MRTADDFAEVAMLRALGHPVRLGIMRALAAEPEIRARESTELFDVTQSTISQHLKVLREAGLVASRRQGARICYSVRPEGLTRLQRLLARMQPALAVTA